jgi:hypothetical protein
MSKNLTNDDLYPGSVINHETIDPSNRESHGKGVVTDIRCPDDCGYIVAFIASTAGTGQCSASITDPRFNIVTAAYI